MIQNEYCELYCDVLRALGFTQNLDNLINIIIYVYIVKMTYIIKRISCQTLLGVGKSARVYMKA